VKGLVLCIKKYGILLVKKKINNVKKGFRVALKSSGIKKTYLNILHV